MDLFDYMRETNKEKESPLASRMRPVTHRLQSKRIRRR